MLTTIVNWLLLAVAEGMDALLTLFFGIFDMQPGDYLSYFPALGYAYDVFKGIGYGLVFIFASVSLIKFFIPGFLGGREAQDTPYGVLFKAAIAGALVWGGNYILEYIIELASVPFDVMKGIDIIDAISDGNFMLTLAVSLGETVFALGFDAGATVLELFVIGMIGFNFLKLIIEIAERYLLVGLMLFTSPPFFAMEASSDTMQMFKSWLKMFISACVMMFVSVFSCKLILSGLASLVDADGLKTLVFIRLLMILAMCKVAQRIDSYLKQIGLGTAETGGSLLEDILATGRRLAPSGGGGHHGESSGKGVLGKAGDLAMKYGFPGSARMQGYSQELSRAIKAGESPTLSKIKEAGARAAAAAPQNNGTAMFKKIGQETKNAVNDAVNSFWMPANERGKEAKDIIKTAGENIKPEASKFGGDITRAAADVFAATSIGGSMLNKSQPAQRLKPETAYRDNQNAVKQDNKMYAQHPNASQPLKANESVLMKQANDSRAKSSISPSDSKQFFKDRGIESTFTLDGNGEPALSPMAVAAGMEAVRDEDGMLVGFSNRDDAITAEFIDEAFGNGAATTFDTDSDSYRKLAEANSTDYMNNAQESAIEETSDLLAETVRSSGPAVAEQAAFNPNYELSGDDNVGSEIANKLFGTYDTEYSNFKTENMPDYTDEQGNLFTGGHIVSADYIDDAGNAYQAKAVNAAGFYQMQAQNPDEAAQYTQITSPTGMTYYATAAAKQSEASTLDQEKAEARVIARNYQNMEPDSANAAAEKITTMSPEMAQMTAFGTNQTLENNDTVGDAMVRKLSGKPEQSYSNVKVASTEAFRDAENGITYPAGRAVTANYSDNGRDMTFNAIDEKEYRKLQASDPEIAAQFTKANDSSSPNSIPYYTMSAPTTETLSSERDKSNNIVSNFVNSSQYPEQGSHVVNKELAQTIASSAPVVAQMAAFDSRHELTGNDTLGSPITQKLSGKDVDYTNFNATNTGHNIVDNEGEIVSEGRKITANYTDPSGNAMLFTAVNEAEYQAIRQQDPNEASQFTQVANNDVESPYGVTYYTRETPVAASTSDLETPAQAEAQANAPARAATIEATPAQAEAQANAPVQTATMVTSPAQTEVQANAPVQAATMGTSPAQAEAQTSAPTQVAAAGERPAQTEAQANAPVQAATMAANPAPAEVQTNAPAQTTTTGVSPAQTEVQTNAPVQSTVAEATYTQTESQTNSATNIHSETADAPTEVRPHTSSTQPDQTTDKHEQNPVSSPVSSKESTHNTEPVVSGKTETVYHETPAVKNNNSADANPQTVKAADNTVRSEQNDSAASGAPGTTQAPTYVESAPAFGNATADAEIRNKLESAAAEIKTAGNTIHQATAAQNSPVSYVPEDKGATEWGSEKTQQPVDVETPNKSAPYNRPSEEQIYAENSNRAPNDIEPAYNNGHPNVSNPDYHQAEYRDTPSEAHEYTKPGSSQENGSYAKPASTADPYITDRQQNAGNGHSNAPFSGNTPHQPTVPVGSGSVLGNNDMQMPSMERPMQSENVPPKTNDSQTDVSGPQTSQSTYATPPVTNNTFSTNPVPSTNPASNPTPFTAGPEANTQSGIPNPVNNPDARPFVSPSNPANNKIESIDAYFAAAEKIQRQVMDNDSMIRALSSKFSSTDLFDGMKLSNMQEYNINGNKGWSINAADATGKMSQYIGIDYNTYRNLSDALRTKFAPVPGTNTDVFVARKDNANNITAPVIKSKDNSGINRNLPSRNKPRGNRRPNNGPHRQFNGGNKKK